jgi:internalin A
LSWLLNNKKGMKIMEVEKLKVLLEKKYVTIVEVYSDDELSKKQDSYLMENNFIVGLNLKNVDIKDIINQILEIETLKYLYLNNVNICFEDRLFFKCQNLQSLDLSGNGLKELPKELFELKNLQSLDLSGNGLKELPKELFELKNLQSLNISGNGLKELPKELFELSRLSQLIIYDEYSVYKDSEKVNKINTIPNGFINLTVLNYFKLDEEYLSSFYKTAYENGLENLKNTIKQSVEQGTSKLYEAKLLFVGEPGAGKTSLMEKIIDKNYVLKDKSNEVSTIGIDIKKYKFDYQDIEFRTNMWDFGGQQIQYMSHQFFLTPNSLYVLVGDDRKQHTDFDYWFHIINLLSDNSPILVVLNEINHKSITNFDLKAYKERFDTHIIDLENIDLSKMDAKYHVVKQKIESMLFNLPHIGDELPAKWIDVRNDLNKIAENNHYIIFKIFKEICVKHGLDNNSYIKTLSNHFHNIGIFLHYSEDTNGLSEIIFLNPKWVMDGIYSVLADKTVNDNNGRFTKEWLFNFWEKHINNYPDDIKNKLLTLMLKDKFEISYKLENEDTFISPQLLPSVLNYEYLWKYSNNLFYRFQYSFMPKGIVARLIVRLNHLIIKENNIELVWKKGVVLKYQNAKAQVIEKETKEGLKVIDISIDGDRFDSQNLLSKIKNEIENIHRKSFPNLNFEEMIPCICDRCIKEKPHYFSFSTLKNYISKEKSFITCEKSVNDVLIAKLLGNVIIKDDESKESQLLEYIKEKGLNVNINTSINNTSNSSTNITDSMNMNQTQTVEITISQTINQVLSELSSLKRKVEDDDDKEEITEIINEFKELGKNPSKEEIIESGLLSDLKDKISEFDETMQRTGQVISKTSKAIQSAKSLGRTYNELASLCGLPNIPFFIVKE